MMPRNLWIYLLLTILCFSLVNASRILCFFPTPSRSHVIIASALLKGLAERGHEVTMVSPFPLEKPMKNYRDIYVPIMDYHDGIIKSVNDKKGENMYASVVTIFQTAYEAANLTIHSDKFQQIMKNESFDLIFTHMMTANYLTGLGAHFKCPTIVISVIQATSIVNEFVANPTIISTMRRHTQFDSSEQQGFKDRLQNFIRYAVEFVIIRTILNWKGKHFYSETFPPDKYPSFDEMQKNASMVFVSHHFSLGNPRPYVPNMIEIGGLHIKQTPDQLPADIQKWFDEATDGVIFLSLGTNFKSKDILPEKLNAILKGFSKLKQRILFKWENDKLSGKPDNVMIKKWVSQVDVLAHPNLKLFITHGGLGSLLEAKYFAVPILGIPLYGDQHWNLQSAYKEGWAKYLKYDEITDYALVYAIDELIKNPIYKKRVKYLSKLFKDRPNKPLDTAIYWSEYVMRHHGAKHLHSSGVHLNFLQYHSIDVITFLIIIIIIIYMVIKSVIILLINKLKCKKKPKKQIPIKKLN